MVSKDKKKKIRKILSALDPSKEGVMAAEQLKEDTTDTLKKVIQNFSDRIKSLKDEILSEFDIQLKKVPDLSGKISLLKEELNKRINQLETEEVTDKDLIALKTELEVKLDDLRKEFRLRIKSLGGGSMPRQINISSSVISTRYSDINLIAGSAMGISRADDDTNKRVNITFSAVVPVAVSSVVNSDGTLTISPTTGAVVASLNLAHANIWTGQQTFVATSDATKGLIVKGFSATQSANLFETQNSTGDALSGMLPGGAIFVGENSANISENITTPGIYMAKVGGIMRLLISFGGLGKNFQIDNVDGEARWLFPGEVFYYINGNANPKRMSTAYDFGFGMGDEAIGARAWIRDNQNSRPLLRLGRDSTSQTSPHLRLEMHSSSGDRRETMGLYGEWATSTDATRKGRVKMTTWDTAEREFLRAESDGARAWAGVPAGNSTSFGKLGGSIFNQFADSTVGGAEADIYTDTTPANTLATNGDRLIAEYGGNFVTGGTELTQLKVYFGGTAIWDSTGLAPATGTTSWRVYVEIIRVSSTIIRYTVSLNTSGATGYVYCTVGELTGLTLSNTNILKITGTSSGVGSGSGDIVGKMSYINWQSAA